MYVCSSFLSFLLIFLHLFSFQTLKFSIFSSFSQPSSSSDLSTYDDFLIASSQNAYLKRLLDGDMTSPSPLATDHSTEVSMDRHIYNLPATRFVLPPPIPDATTTTTFSHSSSSGRPLSSNKVDSRQGEAPEDESILAMVGQAKRRLAKVKGLLSRLRKKANRSSKHSSAAPQEAEDNLMAFLAADSSLYENLTQSLAMAVAANNHPKDLTHDSASDLLESVKDAISALKIQDDEVGFNLPPSKGSRDLYLRETDLDDFGDSPNLVKAVHPVSEQSAPPRPAKPARMRSTPSSTLDTSVTRPTLPRSRNKQLTFHLDQPLYHRIGDSPKQPQANEDRFIDSESAFLSYFDHPLDETLQRLSGESGYSHLKRMTEERGSMGGGDIYDDKVHRFMEAVRRENGSQLLKRNVNFADRRGNRFQDIPEEAAQDTSDDMASFSTLRTDTTVSLALQPPPPPSLASNTLTKGKLPPPIPPKSKQLYFSNPFQVFLSSYFLIKFAFFKIVFVI